MLTPVSDTGTLVSGQLVQTSGVITQDYISKSCYSTGPELSAPTLRFQPMLNPALSVESLVGNQTAGVYKVPYNFVFFPTPISEKSLLIIFFPKLPVLFPTKYSSQQLNIIEKNDIASLFSRGFFPTALIFHSLLHNLIFFSNRLHKLSPQGVWE